MKSEQELFWQSFRQYYPENVLLYNFFFCLLNEQQQQQKKKHIWRIVAWYNSHIIFLHFYVDFLVTIPLLNCSSYTVLQL